MKKSCSMSSAVTRKVFVFFRVTPLVFSSTHPV